MCIRENSSNDVSRAKMLRQSKRSRSRPLLDNESRNVTHKDRQRQDNEDVPEIRLILPAGTAIGVRLSHASREG
jgi:hypothetical protein